jgi:endoglycosylceramidase
VIGPAILTVEQTFDVAIATAEERGWPLWVGEHGIFAVDEPAREVQRRFAAKQDEAIVGGAQWQWRQWCGDPHAIGVPGREPTEVQIQLNDVACPADVDTGPNEEILRVAGRAYPRAAPGRLSELASDPDARTLSLGGVIEDDLATGGDLVVWVPGEERPSVEGVGLGEPRIVEVPGGWYVTVEVVDSPYELELR